MTDDTLVAAHKELDALRIAQLEDLRQERDKYARELGCARMELGRYLARNNTAATLDALKRFVEGMPTETQAACGDWLCECGHALSEHSEDCGCTASYEPKNGPCACMRFVQARDATPTETQVRFADAEAMLAAALHAALDTLVAAYLSEKADKRPSTTTVLELMQWSGARK